MQKSAIAIALAAGLFVVGPSSAQVQKGTLTTSDIPASDARNIAIARQLFKAGALQLSLEHLNSHPPSVSSVDIWRIWAEQKWNIFILLGDWTALKFDAEGLPASFGANPAFSIAYQARAMIALGEFDDARRLLQSTLPSNDISLRLQKDIRTQLIALYLAQGDYSNAKIEAIRFHDEFKPQDTPWFIQRATIEYLAGDAAAAGRLLAAIASIEAKLIQTLFRYEAGELDPKQAKSQIQRQLGRKRISAEERKLALGIEAKIFSGLAALSDQTASITALEEYFSSDAKDMHAGIISFDPLALKKAYIKLSDTLINQALEDPTRSSLKFSLAQRMEQAKTFIQARALYVDVLFDPYNDVLSNSAKNQYVRNLIETDHLSLLTNLFGDGKMINDFGNIENTLTAQVLNYALSEGNTGLIADIAPFLSSAPNTTNALDWLLQKARIDIFTGDFEQGRLRIIDWLGQNETLSGEKVDRVLQAVFDLQAVKQDDLALELFDLIRHQTDSKRHKREILFWKAQSYDAKGERSLAAQFYLRSALVEANGYDQWGHSARFHAASTLMEAGVYTDANRIFKDLLAVTTDVSRRSTIKQGLQRLWLLENRVQAGTE